MNEIRIAENISLPVDVVTQRFGIFGVSGSGKTYTASVLVEEMLEAGAHVVVFDPLGVWWGLRASSDANGDNATVPPIYILGGDHADLPLPPDAGAVIADLVVDERLSVVLDLAHMHQEEQVMFAAAFARQLYARNRDPLHLVVDEADIFAAEQTGSSAEFECRRALDTIVRRGRVRGIGVTLLSQRPAVVAKNLLTQTGTLIVHRIASPQDQKAVDAWFRAHGGEQQRKQVMASLASLPVGEAWLWSPSDLQIFEHVHVRRRHTYDSSATPKVGSQRQEPPKRLAAVDLEGLRERLNTTVKIAEENDPVRLRAQIVSLEKRLRERPVEKVVEEKIVEKPVLSQEALAQLREAMGTAAALGKELGGFHALLAGLVNTQEQPRLIATEIATEVSPVTPARKKILRLPSKNTPKALPAPQRENANLDFSKGERRILEALARYPGQRMTVAQLGTFTKLTPSGGTWAQYTKNLRAQGLIRSGGNATLQISEKGLSLLGASVPPEPHTASELLALWRPALRTREYEMLEYLVSIRPSVVPLDDLAKHFHLTASAGTFGSYIAVLRRNNLIVREGRNVSASPTIP